MVQTIQKHSYLLEWLIVGFCVSDCAIGDLARFLQNGGDPAFPREAQTADEIFDHWKSIGLASDSPCVVTFNQFLAEIGARYEGKIRHE